MTPSFWGLKIGHRFTPPPPTIEGRLATNPESVPQSSSPGWWVARPATSSCQTRRCPPGGYLADALITLGGCDKSVPGAILPLARLDAVGLALYGGAALPGACARGAAADPGTVMEAIGPRPGGWASSGGTRANFFLERP